MSNTKRTWLYVLFALCCMFSVLESQGHSFFIPPAQATTLESLMDDKDELELLIEKRLIAEAITTVYKYVPMAEAIKVVDSVYEYSEAYGLQPSLLLGLIATESSFKRRAVSKEGAAGYTQVIPKYHKDKIKGRNIFHTNVNIDVGAQVFAECSVKHHENYNKVLGCYNGTKNPKKIAKFKSMIHKRRDQLIQLAML